MKTTAPAWRVSDVRAVPGDSAFLIDNGKTAILCDTGFGFTGERIVGNIRRVLNDRAPDYVFLTHSHYDHALAAVSVKNAFPCVRIAAGEYAARIFEKPTAKAVMHDLDRKCAASYGIADCLDLTEQLRADLVVCDGERVADTGFSAISLPGHTRCSVGYYDENSGFFVSPETLGVYYGDDGYIPAFLVGYQMTLDAFARARQLDITAMLLPHWGLIAGADAPVFLDRSEAAVRETAEWVLGCIRRGMDDARILDEYTARIYSDSLSEAYPPDAFRLNSSIMIGIIRREMAGGR